METYQKSGPSNGSTESDYSGNKLTTKNGGWKSPLAIVAIALVALSGLIYFRKSSTSPMVSTGDDLVKAVVQGKQGKELQLFDEFDRYVLEDYDSKPPFSSFLPGIAGLYGKPCWAFYVNRGQAIATFGTRSKDYPIVEFNPANKAYFLTPYIGFRTFLQASRNNLKFLLEPFSPDATADLDTADSEVAPKRVMYIGSNEVEIKELDSQRNIETKITYIILPNEDFSSLLRRTTITNTDSSSDLTLSILDGLAEIEPVGGPLDWMLKNMGRTLEGWFGVHFADDTLTMPFFRMSTEPSDGASVKIEQEGHYVLSFIERSSDNGTRHELLPIVYDSEKIFGQLTTLNKAEALKTKTVKELVEAPQYGDAKTSSAFAAVEEITLKPGESVTIASFYGKTDNIAKVPQIAAVITQPGYVMKKFEEARILVDELTASVDTETADHLFNGFVKQTFLDNALRGGLPVMLGDVDEKAKHHNVDEDSRVKVFHAFSRIHGDLERDYNAFEIVPNFFSEGPGNYRDVAQNRRNDVIFQPRMASFDIRMFLSFIQADGYEPLTVEAVVFIIQDEATAQKVADATVSDPKSNEVLVNVLLGGPFRPGQMFDLLERLNIMANLDVEREEFLNILLSHCTSTPMAVFGTGYWGDHWDYYMDLINAYLAIYPDGEQAMLWNHQLKYFFSTATVKPRSEKYVVTLTFDAKGEHIIQLDATEFDQEKAAEQGAFRDPTTGLVSIDANWQRTTGGHAFSSTPIAKLFLLGLIKFATRDPYGMSIEYEGGRPGWNDAMNGLVGMVGGGTPETFELKKLLEYVLSAVDKYKRSITIPEELGELVVAVGSALDTLDASGYADAKELPFDVPAELFTYWDSVATAREDYRNKTNYYFSGQTTELPAQDVNAMVKRWLQEIDKGIARMMYFGSRGAGDDGTSGVPPCYFAYNVTDWELNGKKNKVGLPLANPKAMSMQQFPLFLEGPVRYMKTITDDKDALKNMHSKVLASGLRDNHLNMFTVSASLEGQSYDMGRMMAFSPGWLENQSVWLHMSYKYYLELLRGKLYTEFFSEMKGGGMLPYMDPKVYGRSLMECSSFLASSAFKDPATQGRGFSARLSGSTAEFLSMWVLMFIGPKPFFLDDEGMISMQLKPALPLWLFEVPEAKAANLPAKTDGTDVVLAKDEPLSISYNLFSTIRVTYINTQRVDLFDKLPTKYEITFTDGTVTAVDAASIPTKLAIRIRKVVDTKSIVAYF
mmetsp:Transcript_27642/g.39532  ORF Transcript_27642/g.39532 Transcript_27642/m.39532 type:complete len:1235 (+) Transcript_27642:139-3843(+)|eukprot:CAMPEP_0172426176 /NCGR_PEP_ID=MMETSP1064-20121228/36094_1 /TAXON_ID=202472 /ORGANISM="Aulacoseira subarctica , Strain CCAP 1002/5" /LENGTH=1234 /DNA_ID=CAMNT_0013169601 /DNA_START=88 /DNA_END=3792 /DNA_ORIENTATION=+